MWVKYRHPVHVSVSLGMSLPWRESQIRRHLGQNFIVKNCENRNLSTKHTSGYTVVSWELPEPLSSVQDGAWRRDGLGLPKNKWVRDGVGRGGDCGRCIPTSNPTWPPDLRRQWEVRAFFWTRDHVPPSPSPCGDTRRASFRSFRPHRRPVKYVVRRSVPGERVKTRFRTHVEPLFYIREVPNG